MQRIVLFIALSILFLSCGFQSRKYTHGHYGNFDKKDPFDRRLLHYEQSPSCLQHEMAENILDLDDHLLPINEDGWQAIERPDTIELIHSEKEKKQNPSTESFSDTIKIKLSKSEEQKLALRPPAVIHSAVLSRRKDTFYFFLTLSLAVTFLSIWLDREYDFAGIMALLFLLIQIWRSTHPVFDIFRIRMLMRRVSDEEQNKKWFRRAKMKNTLAAFLLPLFILTFFLSIIAFLAFAFEMIIFGL